MKLITFANLPETFDWRSLGAISPVIEQCSVCGSCWAIAAVGAIEAGLYIHNGLNELIRLSEQSLIDCTWEYGAQGCGGGYDYQAYDWINENGGIPTYESYGKYRAMEGICHANDSNIVLEAPINGWDVVTSENVNAMKVALFEKGPISVIIHATDYFQSYVAGNANEIFYDPNW